jgi:hypothetical protein
MLLRHLVLVLALPEVTNSFSHPSRWEAARGRKQPHLSYSRSTTTVSPASQRPLATASDTEGSARDDDSVNSETADDDLTQEELALRFSEVREHYRQSNELSQEEICLNLIRTRLSDLRLNRCYVAPSTIPNAGQGLLASRPIDAGELITLFPGDALLVWNHTVGDFSNGNYQGAMFGNHVTDRDAALVSTAAARAFELKIGPQHSIVADPTRLADAAYLGHMANDGAMLSRTDRKARTRYAQTTRQRHNAAFFEVEGSHFAATATKDIGQDEEIFVSYGEGYWMSRISSMSSSASSSAAPPGSTKGFGRRGAAK